MAVESLVGVLARASLRHHVPATSHTTAVRVIVLQDPFKTGPIGSAQALACNHIAADLAARCARMQALASACSHATAHPHRPRRVQQSASLDPIPTAHTLLQPQHHHSPWLSRAHPGQPCPHRGPVPAARSSVTAQARGRPKKTPPKDAGADAQEDDSASPSGWDAALAGIPAIQAGSDLVVEDDEEIYAGKRRTHKHRHAHT